VLCIAVFSVALPGCATDCDDAVGKLTFCDLPAPATLGEDCDDEGPTACQARCVRDLSCDRLTASILGQSPAFDECAATCGAGELLDELTPDDVDGGAEQ
jgi:hypothetical protein